MRTKFENIIVDLVCRTMIPFILLFGFYVVAHGHSSPGGGFQGGAILAASVMLLRLSMGKEKSSKIFPPRLGPVLGAIGLLIYGGTGLVTLIWGGMYLDYVYLPIPGVSDAALRYIGILIVEIGVALAVFGVLFSIFDYLVEG